MVINITFNILRKFDVTFTEKYGVISLSIYLERLQIPIFYREILIPGNPKQLIQEHRNIIIKFLIGVSY